jgi:hypothetical protein
MLELLRAGVAMLLLGAAPAATILVARRRKVSIQRLLREGFAVLLGGVTGMAPGVLLLIGRAVVHSTGTNSTTAPGNLPDWAPVVTTLGGMVAGALLGLVLVAKLSRRVIVPWALAAGVGGLALGCCLAFAAVVLAQGSPFELAVLGAIPVSVACTALAPYLRTA